MFTGNRVGPGLVSLLAVLMCAGAAASRVPVRDPLLIQHPARAPQWVVAHRMPGVTFKAVAAVAADDVWVVGTAVLRWNGRRWRDVPAPAVPLESISGSASGVWAVGENAAWEWDGARWRRLPRLALPADYEGYEPRSLSLKDVVATSPSSVWVVGTVYWEDPEWGDSFTSGIVERWDGRTWNVVDDDTGSSLDAVSSGRSGRIWAAGSTVDGAYVTRVVGAWDGERWATWEDDELPFVGTDSGDYESNAFLGIDARRADDVWAVGSNLGRPFVEHWNGRRWQHAHPAGQGSLAGVAAVGPSETWAVGEASGAPMIVHRTSHGWRRATAPKLGGGLVDIAALSPSRLWAVGGDTVLQYRG